VTDSNDEKELAGLVHVRPFAAGDIDVLRGLRLSLGGSVTDQDDVPSQNLDLISTELSIQYLDSVAGGPAFDGLRWRLVPQFAWPIGPFCVRGEYLHREDELAEGAAEDEIVSRGWYATASYILTGEDKVLDDRIAPKGEGGAVELLFRYAHLKVDHVFDAGLAPRAGNSDEVASFTAGVNWWVTLNVRLSLNAIHEVYDEDLAFDHRTEDKFFGLIFRGQVDF
jgi:phosphate-selective porin